MFMSKVVLDLATGVRVDLLNVGLDASLLLEQLLVMAVLLFGLDAMSACRLDDSNFSWQSRHEDSRAHVHQTALRRIVGAHLLEVVGRMRCSVHSLSAHGRGVSCSMDHAAQLSQQRCPELPLSYRDAVALESLR